MHLRKLEGRREEGMREELSELGECNGKAERIEYKRNGSEEEGGESESKRERERVRERARERVRNKGMRGKMRKKGMSKER